MYIRRNIRWRVVRDGSVARMEIPEVPVEAVREALLNSYAHRDWRVPQTNEIAIYSNRIEIYNPGTFPEGFTPQDFIGGLGKSIHRNPLLAQILYYSKDIESFGTGLHKIAMECEGAGVRYGFELSKLGFSVIFYRPDIYNGATDESSGTQNGTHGTQNGTHDVSHTVTNKSRTEEIVGLIDNNRTITRSEMAEILDVSKRTIARDIAVLKTRQSPVYR